jgi:hypothetical protein
MEPATILLFLGVLACPIAMGYMSWKMNRKMGSKRGPSHGSEKPAADLGQRLTALRSRREAVEAEITELTSVLELERRRERLKEAGGSPIDEASLATARLDE